MVAPTSIGRNVKGRITAVVKQVESQPIFRREHNVRTPVIAAIGGVLEGITTSTITAATVSAGVITYGTGTVQIVIDHMVSGVPKSMNDPAYPTAVTTYSTSTTTGGVPSGTNVCIAWRNGRYVLVNVNCGN